MKARLIRITPQINKSTEELFFNYGFSTKKPASEVLGTKDWADAKVLGLKDEPVIFGIATDVVLPSHVLRHIFAVENIVITMVRDEAGAPLIGKNGQPVFNGLRASADVYPVFNYIERGGAEVKGLPPPPEGWQATAEKVVGD